MFCECSLLAIKKMSNVDTVTVLLMTLHLMLLHYIINYRKIIQFNKSIAALLEMSDCGCWRVECCCTCHTEKMFWKGYKGFHSAQETFKPQQFQSRQTELRCVCYSRYIYNDIWLSLITHCIFAVVT